MPNSVSRMALSGAPFTMLLMGDSNSRLIFRAIEQIVHTHGRVTQRAFVTRDGERTKWSDLEFRGVWSNRSLRVRFVFIHDQGELDEVYGARAPVLLSPMPDLVWFTHGLWHIDSHYKKPCTERFVVEGRLMDQLRSKTTLVWQTNVRVRRHPQILDEWLVKDTQCQYAWGKNHSVPVFNIRTFPVAGFHLRNANPIAQEILAFPSRRRGIEKWQRSYVGN